MDDYHIIIYKNDEIYADNRLINYNYQNINKKDTAKLFILEVTSIVINQCNMEESLEFYNIVNHLMNNLK